MRQTKQPTAQPASTSSADQRLNRLSMAFSLVSLWALLWILLGAPVPNATAIATPARQVRAAPSAAFLADVRDTTRGNNSAAGAGTSGNAAPIPTTLLEGCTPESKQHHRTTGTTVPGCPAPAWSIETEHSSGAWLHGRPTRAVPRTINVELSRHEPAGRAQHQIS